MLISDPAFCSLAYISNFVMVSTISGKQSSTPEGYPIFIIILSKPRIIQANCETFLQSSEC